MTNHDSSTARELMRFSVPVPRRHCRMRSFAFGTLLHIRECAVDENRPSTPARRRHALSSLIVLSISTHRSDTTSPSQREGRTAAKRRFGEGEQQCNRSQSFSVPVPRRHCRMRSFAFGTLLRRRDCAVDGNHPSTPARRRHALLLLLLAVITPLLSVASASEEPEASSYTEPPISDFDRDHWAYQPIAKPDLPVVASNWVRNDIDRFILSRLTEEELTPQPSASRRVLIRRLSYDLTGLPPTPEEIAAFEADESDDAYQNLVERLLASPRYGERWAQHWLDLARFAETDGFEHDKVRPEAWTYRDWVINALNSDMPYDEFLKQQLAGDELYPEDKSAAIATYFLLAGPDMPDINLESERRHNVLNEMVSTVGEAVLGLQMGCAQCHDHKYDPISMADFYRLRAVFEPGLKLKKNQSHTVMQGPSRYDDVSHVMLRGDFRSPGPAIEPGLLRVANISGQTFEPQPTEQGTGRRTALAEWITSPHNPLTARVIVNRVWQHHFGNGLVDTASDFGLMGTGSTHPDLLDYLATYLIEHDWSLKSLHRLIVNSATYQQRSYLPDVATGPERDAWYKGLEADRSNELLARYSRWRLEGEAIRDAMLQAAGTLNLKAGGPGVRPPLPEELVDTLLKNQWNVTKDKSEHTRRSIYVFARRNLRYPIFEVFDRPAANSSCPERNVSTTAPQSLHLLNSQFSYETAQQVAKRLTSDSSDHDKQMEKAFQITLGRPPVASEREAVQAFWTKHSSDEEALTHLCLSLFNSNEFVVID